jgi:hypothetical protein
MLYPLRENPCKEGSLVQLVIEFLTRFYSFFKSVDFVLLQEIQPFLHLLHQSSIFDFNLRASFARLSFQVDKPFRKIPKLNVCAHLIFGIPGESEQQLIETANLLNKLWVHGVKLHNLHVLRNTPLAEEYRLGLFSPIDLEEYAKRVVLFLENLDHRISVHRLTAVAPRWDELIAPEWTKEKMRPAQYIENMLETRGTWQGRMLKNFA